MNEVTPLTAADLDADLQTNEVSGRVTAVAAFTDGCQRAGLERRHGRLEPFPSFFGPVFYFAGNATSRITAEQELLSFLSSTKMRNSSEDDKTMLVAVLAREDG